MQRWLSAPSLGRSWRNRTTSEEIWRLSGHHDSTTYLRPVRESNPSRTIDNRPATQQLHEAQLLLRASGRAPESLLLLRASGRAPESTQPGWVEDLLLRLSCSTQPSLGRVPARRRRGARDTGAVGRTGNAPVGDRVTAGRLRLLPHAQIRIERKRVSRRGSRRLSAHCGRRLSTSHAVRPATGRFDAGCHRTNAVLGRNQDET